MSTKLESNGIGWTNVRHGVAWMAGLFVLTLAFAGPASASTYTATQFSDDDGPFCTADTVEDGCTLREAVKSATGPDDEVVLLAGTYELLPVLGTIRPANGTEGSVLIRGAGARQTIVDGNDGVRPFTFEDGSQGELRDLAVTGGNGRSCNTTECSGFEEGNGGAVLVDDNHDGGGDAVVTLTRVRLFDSNVDFDGGAVQNNGQLTITQSLVDGNVAGQDGGGIENDDELTLTNSTVSGNEAVGSSPSSLRVQAFGEGNGGGIDNDGDAGDFGTEEKDPFLEVQNSTIAANTAAGNGGGVYTFVDPCEQNPSECETQLTETGGPVSRFHNSLVTDNTADGDTNCSGNQPAGSGVFTSSEGHNMEDGDSCQFTAAGDLDRKSDIEALADNGGQTNTHALKNVSAAIDAAESDGCPTVDQRGTARPQRTACDIGAFERVPEPVQEQAPPQQQQEQLPPQQTPEARGPRCLDSQPPLTNLDRDGLRVTESTVTLSGTSRDRGHPCASGVQRVEVSMAKVSGTDLNCRFIRRSNRFVLTPFINCRQPVRFVADGTTQWQFRFRVKLKPGKYRAQARGYDEVRNKETPKKRVNIVVFTVK